MSRFVTVTEVARVLGVSRPTALKRLRSGEVPGLGVYFRRYRVSREVFDAWAKSEDHGKSGKVLKFVKP